MSLIIILDDESWYQIKLRHWQNDQLNRYTNELICIFIDINENIRNKKKMVEN